MTGDSFENNLPSGTVKDGTDAVGYAQPPRAHQFQKGTSGNPRGRPKKQPQPDAIDVFSVLDELVHVRKNGQATQMASKEVILRRQAKKALEGDLKALLHLLDQFETHGLLGTPAVSAGARGVVTLPSDRMPFAMARIMAAKFGVKEDYTEAQLAEGRAAYVDTRSETQAKIDDEIGYADLPKGMRS